jgi:predicted PurR-regulated permease PerM
MRKLVFLVLFFGLFILVARLFYPFLTIILWAGLIYAFFYKLYARAATRRDGAKRREATRNLLAGAFALGAVTLLAVPALFLARAVIAQVSELAGAAKGAIEQNPSLLDLSPDSPIGGLAFRLSGGQLNLANVDLVAEVKRFLSGKSVQIIGFSGKVLKDLAGMLFNLAFMVFTLYFFFVDGEHLARTFVSAIPIDKAYTRLFLRKLRDTGKQLLLGLFLVALFQGTMLFLICLIMGVKGSLVLACLAVFAAFIPMVGTALVWVPVAAGIALGGNLPQAILFLVLSAIFVSSLDNFIRPILLHDRLKIHPLLIFFSILGGLSLFGFNGIVIGPLVLMLFFSAAELYDQAFDPPEESRVRRELDARGEGEAPEAASGQATSKGDGS